MIDRESRSAVLAGIDDYLFGRIKTFEFDKRVEFPTSPDGTVRQIWWLVWPLYDDLINHPVKLTRQQWNYVQRLRLILQSDAEIKQERFWTFTWVHQVGLPALLLLVITGVIFGLGAEFWAADFLGGVVFVIAMHFSTKSRNARRAAELIPVEEMFPFQDFATMRSVYEGTPTFQKMPYRRDMDMKPLRRVFTVRAMMLPWLFFWPVLVVAGLLSFRGSRYSVVRKEMGRETASL